MPITPRKRMILKALLTQPGSGITSIKELIQSEASTPTLNRDLKELVDEGLLVKSGAGRTTVYAVSKAYQLLNNDIGDSYFERDVDERKGNKKN